MISSPWLLRTQGAIVFHTGLDWGGGRQRWDEDPPPTVVRGRRMGVDGGSEAGSWGISSDGFNVLCEVGSQVTPERTWGGEDGQWREGRAESVACGGESRCHGERVE